MICGDGNGNLLLLQIAAENAACSFVSRPRYVVKIVIKFAKNIIFSSLAENVDQRLHHA